MPKLRRGLVQALAENDAHVFLVIEAATLGDLDQWQIRRRYQLHGPLDPDRDDLIVDGLSKRHAKTPLEHAAGNSSHAGNFINGNPFARTFTDVSQRTCDRWIFHGKHIAGLPSHYAMRRNQTRLTRRVRAEDELMKQSGGLIANAEMIRPHAAQRRIADFAQRLVVIHAHDRHLVRNMDIHTMTRIEHIEPSLIAAHHQSDWLGQIAQPSRETILPLLPRRAFEVGSREFEMLEFTAKFSRVCRKGIAAPLRPIVTAPRPLLSSETAKGELPKAAIVQMLKGEPGDCDIIDVDERKGGSGHHSEDINDR